MTHEELDKKLEKLNDGVGCSNVIILSTIVGLFALSYWSGHEYRELKARVEQLENNQKTQTK